MSGIRHSLSKIPKSLKYKTLYRACEEAVAFPTSTTSTSSETEVANAIETTNATTSASASVASSASSTTTTTEDESFFHSVVTKTVDGFVVSSSSSSGFRGGKIIFPSKPSLLAVQPKEESTLPKKNKNQKSKSFVVPSWFTKLTQRYVERQKRTPKGLVV